MTRMATQNQITFIATNKYYKVTWVTKVNLTFEDAEKMCENISPYSDGNCNYYYRIRTKKEIWLPRLLSFLVSMAEKYGVEEYSKEYTQELNKFNLTLERKRKREEMKMLQQKEKQSDEIRKRLIQNIIAEGGVLNATKGSRTPFCYTYLDGELEIKNGFDDMVFLSDRGRKEYFQQAERNLPYIWNKSSVCEYKGVQVYIEDLDEIAYLVFFKKRVICGEENYIGLVVSDIEYHMDSFISALEIHYKNCPF